MLRFEGTQTCLAVLAVHIEDPDARGHAGADGNIAIGNPPVSPDGFRVGRRGVEATLNGWLLCARQAWEDGKAVAPGIGERGVEGVHRSRPHAVNWATAASIPTHVSTIAPAARNASWH